MLYINNVKTKVYSTYITGYDAISWNLPDGHDDQDRLSAEVNWSLVIGECNTGIDNMTPEILAVKASRLLYAMDGEENAEKMDSITTLDGGWTVAHQGFELSKVIRPTHVDIDSVTAKVTVFFK